MGPGANSGKLSLLSVIAISNSAVVVRRREAYTESSKGLIVVRTYKN